VTSARCSGPLGDSLPTRIGAWSRCQAGRALVSRGLDLHVSGLEYIPDHGPAILVARHYHHLYDAAAILASVPREVHVLVAVDWLDGWRLALVRRLAAAARWPVVWRRGSAWRVNREGYRASLRSLEQGRLLLIFPEGYPTIDPRWSSRRRDAFLTFDPGFVVLAQRATCDVPLIPVGLSYSKSDGQRWSVWLRFGAPLCHAGRRAGREAMLANVELAVRELSAPPA
jgi:putative membrane protein